MSENFVSVDHDGPLAVVRLDRGELNPFDGEASRQLAEAARELAVNESTRSVVIWGGPKNFAAGADIAELQRMGFEEIVCWNANLQNAFTGFARLPVPVIAAMTGYALGGGLELALCADYRIAADDSRIGLPEVTLGIIPGSGGTQRLTRIVGRSRAKEMIMSGRIVYAEEALARGLVDEVHAADDVFGRAVELASKFAKGPRFALRAAKEAIDAAEAPIEPGLTLERSLIAGLFATEDRRLGMESFVTSGPGRAQFS